MTTQQQQPTEPQTEQQEQPTPPEQPPRAEAAESLGRQMAHLEGGVEQLDRRLDDNNHRIDETNRSLEGLRGDMDTKFAESRAEMNAKFAESRAEMNTKFAELRAEMNRQGDRQDARMDRQDERMARMEAKLNQLFYVALSGLITLVVGLIAIIGTGFFD